LLSGKLTGTGGFRFFVSANASKWTTTLNNTTGNPNDYAGNTVVNSAPTTLSLGAANQIPNGPGKGNVDVTAGTLDLAGFSETINGLIGTGTVDNVATGTSNTLTLGDGDATGTSFSGVIKNTNGTLSLAKIGTGTQTLSGPNAYTGTTTVNGGVLHLTGSLATGSAVTVGGEAATGTPTLSGSGTVNGTLTIAAAGGGAEGIVNPGTVGTTGILNAGATTIAGTYACDVNGAATDRLVVNGDLTLGGTLSINEIATGTPGTYVIATYTGSRIGTLGGGLPSNYSVNYDDSNKEVELVIVGSDYTTWGAPYGLTAGSEGDDLDNDGLTNFAEYAFGLLPNDGASVNPISEMLDKSTGLFKYTRRSTTAFATGVTYTYEYSTTLNGGWTPFTPASLATDNGNPVEEITVGVPGGLLTEPKLFIHVKANN
jgi:autotransporter-associated beta strand protein